MKNSQKKTDLTRKLVNSLFNTEDFEVSQWNYWRDFTGVIDVTSKSDGINLIVRVTVHDDATLEISVHGMKNHKKTKWVYTKTYVYKLDLSDVNLQEQINGLFKKYMMIT